MKTTSHQVITAAHQSKRRLFPSTPTREHRLRHGIPLAVVALRAGISAARVSCVERDPSIARPGELDALKAAVDALAAEAE